MVPEDDVVVHTTTLEEGAPSKRVPLRGPWGGMPCDVFI